MATKPTPKPKNTGKSKPKGLNDFLKEGKRPPSKNKKLPSDADVIIKGYNDKKTAAKKAASKVIVKSKAASTSKPKPAPSPTSASQLKNTTRAKDANGNMVVKSGVFGNKIYDVKDGKPVLNKKETDYWFNSPEAKKRSKIESQGSIRKMYE
jgi:hypothetical protein